MRVFVFGSSITSAYWNGAATYYRGIYKKLCELGYEITFAEPDIYQRQQNRDVSEIEYANVIVYQTPRDIADLLKLAATADLVIKHSGVGAEDELLEKSVLQCRSARTQVAFWDVDAPATLARVEGNTNDYFRPLISQFDFVFTYGGGSPVAQNYLKLGARNCHPIYNALDPETHYPVEPTPRFASDLVFVGNRLPDREARVEQFFLRAADLAPEMKFILGGEGWSGKPLPTNVHWVGHVGTGDHNVMNSSARMVLNINRDSMAKVGFSPPTRVFEAAGAASCVITDEWDGVEMFFEPGKEILIARGADDIVKYLRGVSAEQASRIGEAMHERALIDHTYALRAQQLECVLMQPRGQRHPSALESEAFSALLDSGRTA